MDPIQARNPEQLQEIQDCDKELPPLAQKGILLFNAGHYFEAHEELETAWRQETRPIRELYRGILQVAVAYLHVRNGNLVGAKKMFLRSRRWLAPFPDICQGVHVEQLRRDAAAVEMALKMGSPAVLSDASLLKPVQVD